MLDYKGLDTLRAALRGMPVIFTIFETHCCQEGYLPAAAMLDMQDSAGMQGTSRVYSSVGMQGNIGWELEARAQAADLKNIWLRAIWSKLTSKSLQQSSGQRVLPVVLPCVRWLRWCCRH